MTWVPHPGISGWVPHPNDRPYQCPDYVPTVKVRVNGPSGSTTLKAPHWPFKQDVQKRVTDEMRRRRHCVIRAVLDDGLWKAAEGSHRIWAAHELDVTIDLQPIDRKYVMQHDNPDLGVVTAGSIIDVGPKVRGPDALYTMEVT